VAETVIDGLEHAANYKAFERAIKSNYSPQTAIEGQLVSRLASLLWRLRRAVIVESELLNIQAEMLGDRMTCSPPISEHDVDRLSIFRKFLHPIDFESPMSKQQGAKEEIGYPIQSNGAETNQTNTNIARSFLSLTSLNNQVFERLGRYEINLSRQTAQILLLLNSIEFRANDRLPDERPHFRRVRRKRRYPPFGFDPFLRSAMLSLTNPA
jgi:hypothetical protein